jgi:hypothetical protein
MTLATAQTALAGLGAWITAVERDGPDERRQALSAFRTWRAEVLACFYVLPTCLTNGFADGKTTERRR